MDISSINSDYLKNVMQNASSTASTSGLEDKLNSFQNILDAKRTGTEPENAEQKVSDTNVLSEEDEAKRDKELMDACKQFEAYFIEQVFKEMKKSVNLTQSEDAATQQLMSYYEDNLTSEYAKMAADQQENGLAQMLYEQMKRNIEM